MADKAPENDEEMRGKLSPEQYEVTQRRGTEPAFSGKYVDCKEDGVYRCVCCGAELFSSDTKFESGSGWPSFYEAMNSDRVEASEDLTHGMRRIEVTCTQCGAHLGHVFDDGPQPTGKRYCINSCALDLDKKG